MELKEKYLELLRLAGQIGFRCCIVDKDEVKAVEEAFKDDDHYYLSKDVDGFVYLNWE